ncbi:MAG: tryptophan--tRNA ligase [Candidatus Magasanikbacteria bacterium]|nr:tryptophan--tRNA ligase [Candidatus Magasanikbacteria bacterium]
MSKPVIVSGIQPTGNLHIGNYLGAVKNWLELQKSGKYELYIFIADLHSLTGKLTAEQLREQVKITAAELLAAGIDPDKTTFFVQSQVVGHTDLAWIFNCVTPIAELYRMTQFKDKSGAAQTFKEIESELENIQRDGREYLSPVVAKNTLDFFKTINRSSVGLFDYPVLQAADILIYKGELVPVGQDQVQHVELTRDIARWFNNRYGEFFSPVQHKLTTVPKVMSLLEPEKKMSKSLGAGHVVELRETPEEIENKLKKAVTATSGGGQAPGVANLLGLLKEFGEKKVYDAFVVAEKDGSIRYGDLKKSLGEAIAKHFEDFRAGREKLLKDPKKLDKILAKGAAKAQKVADKNMTEVRKLVGIR